MNSEFWNRVHPFIAWQRRTKITEVWILIVDNAVSQVAHTYGTSHTVQAQQSLGRPRAAHIFHCNSNLVEYLLWIKSTYSPWSAKEPVRNNQETPNVTQPKACHLQETLKVWIIRQTRAEWGHRWESEQRGRTTYKHRQEPTYRVLRLYHSLKW
jgi:hypothetical protein